MVLAPSVAGLFKWRQFEPEVILLAIGWYLVTLQARSQQRKTVLKALPPHTLSKSALAQILVFSQFR
jgi:hypothetical protein